MEAFYVLGGMLAVLVAVYFIYDIVERSWNKLRNRLEAKKVMEATPEYKEFEKAKKAEDKAWKTMEKTPEWKAKEEARKAYIEILRQDLSYFYNFDNVKEACWEVWKVKDEAEKIIESFTSIEEFIEESREELNNEK